MNIIDLGDLALSALPQQAAGERCPQLDATLLSGEQVEAGVRWVFVLRRGTSLLYRFPPDEWQLLQLFDGKRSYAEIAAEHAHRSGVTYTEQDVREYVRLRLETTPDLFVKTAADKKLARMQTLNARRHGRSRRKFDLAEIRLLWIDPHAYLTWVHQKFRFLFTPWFTAVTLVLWSWMFYQWAIHWGEIWNDSVQYFNFNNKGLLDVVEFWCFFLAVAVTHETAHGLATIHSGGESHAMGLMLMWMSPAFFCDCGEVYIYGGKWQRISVAFAGMWSELLLCVVATALWLGTAPGMLLHDLAYKILLVGGVLLIILNLNPLIKLDGYYIFTDLINQPDLKEEATAYSSNLIRKIFGLPHELSSMRTRRKLFYFIYSLLSGTYSYFLLILFSEIGYNVSRRFWPEWAALPAAAIAFLLFKSRLKRLAEFMKTVYLDKKQRWIAWLSRPANAIPLAATLAVILFVPFWRETVSAPFLLDAPVRATVRAEVPGSVVGISAREGEHVEAGQRLAQMRDLGLASDTGRAGAEYQLALARAFQAQLQYADLGSRQNEVRRAEQHVRDLARETARLQVVSPISGVVVTPRPQDLLGSYLPAGSTILEVAQTSVLRATIYVPEAYMRDVRIGAPVSLKFSGSMRPVHAVLSTTMPGSTQLPKALADRPRYKGLGEPVRYAAWANVQNNGGMRVGMLGEAKIQVRRRSLAGFLWRALADSAARRIW